MTSLSPRFPITLACAFFFCAFWLAPTSSADEPGKIPALESKVTSPRQFRFNYGATITDQTPGAEALVWFPIPANSRFQNVKLTEMHLPGILHINTGRQYGNKIGFFEAKVPDSGSLTFSLNYEVSRWEAGNDVGIINESNREKFLANNRLVPTSGKPVELIGDKKLDANSMQLGSQLYEIVEQYMAYDKSKPGYGNGDVLWACSSKTGNCTDFHSLFISLARSQGLPARFEIGFPLPSDSKQGDIKGYHCWAWFDADQLGWVPVDISEADKHPELKEYYFGRLTPDRIAFSTGRDIELIPKAASANLNYFVYPHVEVNGKPIAKTQLKFNFSFADITPNEKTAVRN